MAVSVEGAPYFDVSILLRPTEAEEGQPKYLRFFESS